MRRFIMGFMLAVGLGLAGISTGSAAPITGSELGHATVVAGALEKVQYAGYCARLKRKCEYKEERGEQGQGNCHRYRTECGRANYCEKLRQACRYKEERGEQGEGNCRKYRYECGGSR